MTENRERFGAVDLATDAIVRYTGFPVGDPVVAGYVDTFTDQLTEVAMHVGATSVTPTWDMVLAGIEMAKAHPGAVAAGWMAYIAAIRSADDYLFKATAGRVAEAESFLEGRE